MKGNEKLISTLNALLADELTAINQYMVHSEMCDDWGYEKLHKHFEKRAIDEMKHAEKLIGRIYSLKARPTVSTLNKIMIGGDVIKQLLNDHTAEEGAIKAYNEAIILTRRSERFCHHDMLQLNLNDQSKAYKLDCRENTEAMKRVA